MSSCFDNINFGNIMVTYIFTTIICKLFFIYIREKRKERKANNIKYTLINIKDNDDRQNNKNTQNDRQDNKKSQDTQNDRQNTQNTQYTQNDRQDTEETEEVRQDDNLDYDSSSNESESDKKNK